MLERDATRSGAGGSDVTWLLVGAGGALGAMARHGLNALVHRWILASPFPYGIFAVNVLGSLLIGLFAGLLGADRVHAQAEARLFIVVGVLGGFTTFSSFSLDTLALLRGGHVGLALLNSAGQVVAGGAAAFVGYRLGSMG